MEVTPPTVPDEPILVVQWERTLAAVLDRTAQFPKSERHTFAARVDGRALDVLEALVQARWASRREMDEAGRMLGGWRRSLVATPNA